VRGISLHVDEGELVGLIGPNGAGKTTTLSSIVGVVPVASGSITFEGRPLAGTSPEAIVRGGIALVPEGRRIFGRLTVEENLRLGATGRSDADVGRDAAEMMERFPILERYRSSPAGKLSGGEQQQLAIARALMSRPRLLLMDEPSLGLAPLMVNRVFELIAELRSEGMTTLLVEQNARRTLKGADRTYVLQNGTLQFETTAGQADVEHVEQHYFGIESREAV